MNCIQKLKARIKRKKTPERASLLDVWMEMMNAKLISKRKSNKCSHILLCRYLLVSIFYIYVDASMEFNLLSSIDFTTKTIHTN